MNSLIPGVSPALLAQILAELGPRYSWAFNSEPVCIVARMLQREIDSHGNTRSALQILQDTTRKGLGARYSGLGKIETTYGQDTRYEPASEEPN
jgi:hypothetical protein